MDESKLDYKTVCYASSSNTMYNPSIVNDVDFPMVFEVHFTKYKEDKNQAKYLVNVIGSLKDGFELTNGEFCVSLDGKFPHGCGEWNKEVLVQHEDSDDFEFLHYSFDHDEEEGLIVIKARNCSWQKIPKF